MTPPCWKVDLLWGDFEPGNWLGAEIKGRWKIYTCKDKSDFFQRQGGREGEAGRDGEWGERERLRDWKTKA